MKFPRKNNEPPLKVHEVADKMPSHLTRRMILSQVASIYDPLGLVAPVTLVAKKLMRDLCMTEPGGGPMWDVPVDAELKRRALVLFTSFFSLEQLRTAFNQL